MFPSYLNLLLLDSVEAVRLLLSHRRIFADIIVYIFAH